MIFSRLSLASLFAVSGLVVLAHDGATGVVKERMDAMVSQGKAMKVLAGETRSSSPDLDTVRAAAEVIRTRAGQSLLDGFPHGSLPPVSEARAEIWDEWTRFSDLAFALESAAEALVTANPETDLAASFAALKDTCGACHKAFRVEK